MCLDPRNTRDQFEVVTRHTLFAAAALVIAVWSVQHVVLPFIPDAKYAIYPGPFHEL